MATALDKTLFNMKFTSKQLAREGKKSEKKMKEEEKKVFEARKRNDAASARIHAENYIRAKNEALNFLRISSRIDAVSARVETAVRMNALTKQLGSVVTGMDTVLTTMDPTKISKMMDRFESQFDSLDVVSNTMERSMASSTATTIPEEDVDAVIGMVDTVYAVELKESMESARTGAVAIGGVAAPGAAGRVAEPVAAAAAAPPSMPPPPGSGPVGPSGGGGGPADGGMPGFGGGGGTGHDVADALSARLAALRK